MPGIHYHAWRPAAWIEAGGEDSFSFLQGQFTNDLEGAGCRYGLWLDRKGRVQADSFVLGAGEAVFFLASYFSPAAEITGRLEPYIIADDVLLADRTAEARAVSTWGGELSALLAVEGVELKEGLFRTAGMVVFDGRRSGGRSIEWVFFGSEADGKAAEFRERLDSSGARPVNADAVKRERIRAGIPAIPAELGPKDLPQEGRLEESALSFTKGCYLGQEVMARIRSMGAVRRKLVCVSIDGDEPPSLPAVLYREGKEAGALRGCTADLPLLGLAMVRDNLSGQGIRFSFSPEGEDRIHIVDCHGK